MSIDKRIWGIQLIPYMLSAHHYITVGGTSHMSPKRILKVDLPCLPKCKDFLN